MRIGLVAAGPGASGREEDHLGRERIAQRHACCGGRPGVGDRELVAKRRAGRDRVRRGDLDDREVGVHQHGRIGMRQIVRGVPVERVARHPRVVVQDARGLGADGRVDRHDG